MAYYNPENREPMRCGIIAVVAYFALFTVLMVTLNFSIMPTDQAAQGLLVEFGESLDGLGEEELAASDVAATPPPKQEQPQEQNLLTDESQDIALEQQEVKSKSEATAPQIEQPVEQRDTIIPEERVVNVNALFPGRNEQSTSSSQGSSTAAGNQGSPSGAESGAVVGGGDGDDPVFELKNRSVVGSLPKPAYSENISGKVIVDITVDELGRVKSATYRAQGSTTNNSTLVAAAREAALKARFTSSDNFIQGGSITYIFKMN